MGIYTFGLMLQRYILPLCLALHLASAGPLLLPDMTDKMASSVAALTMDHRYDEAISRSQNPNATKDPAFAVFRAMVYVARFDDMGRLADLDLAWQQLSQAEGELDQVPANSDLRTFWQGFIKVQQGFILASQGNDFKGALRSREGSLILQTLKDNSDAQGFASIYRFYKSQLTGKLNPWSDAPLGEIAQISKSKSQTRYFEALFANAQGWMDFDLKRYNETANTAFAMVQNHPQNRLFRQMAGDALRRSRNYSAARDWYRISVEQYRKVAPGSVRHVSALANMRLISKFLGDQNALQNYTLEYNRWLAPVKDRLPPSLVDELKKNDLWN